jgi:NAD(P)H-dependent FMN reductase
LTKVKAHRWLLNLLPQILPKNGSCSHPVWQQKVVNSENPVVVNFGVVRSVEHLRLVMAELQVADVRAQVTLSLFTDFENFTKFRPAPYQEQALNTLIDQVRAWGTALKALRSKK